MRSTPPRRVYHQPGVIDAGYTRTTGTRFSPAAVEWWFFRVFDDGYAFARGGHVRSSRAARKEIRGLYDSSKRAHAAWLRRPERELLPSGDVREISYS